MGLELFDYQLDAVNRMKNGCILCGGVGSGKSLTSLAYYHILNGGKLTPFKPMINPIDIYIITTARKRDTKEWEGELCRFLLSTNFEINEYSNKVIVDSWNNIGKYVGVENSFFIFDEQRLVGWGAWTKAFLKIAKVNQWILLSATPGDTWQDYTAVFIANGFYKNKTDFQTQHIAWDRYSKWPRIKAYLDQGKLVKHRNDILIDMDFKRQTVAHHEYIYCQYDRTKYKEFIKGVPDPFDPYHKAKIRKNPYTDEIIENASQFCYTIRRIVNDSENRLLKLLEICEEHPKLIVFYNYDYELEMLKAQRYINIVGEAVQAEWNGHKHEPIPQTDSWIYFVQYTAGCEGWNCIETDTIVFFSQNYSYRIMEQATGRIDRLNTPFKDLYYYHLSSKSPIDISIARAVEQKKIFNESRYVNKLFKKES